MPGLQELKVSLTKNGYFKVAEVIKAYPRDQVLDNIGLDRAQMVKMLSGNEATGELPQVWDDVKALGPEAVDALTFISIIYSHVTLIEGFKGSIVSEMRGVLKRSKFDEKVYTNLVDTMDKMKLGKKVYGAQEFSFSLKPLFKEMAIGPLAKDILTRKLLKTGWKEPQPSDYFQRNFYEQCFFFGFHRVLGISEQQFQDWLEGETVEMEEPPPCIADDDPVEVSGSLVAALASKPFVIMSGTSGTGKTQTVRALTKALCPKDVDLDFNHVFIPVEAGWTDGRNLLGYRNPFGKTGEYYASTPLIELLLRANFPQYSGTPFFIVLDEMNLSYVEQYFSRFLSLMETSYGSAANPEPVINIEDLLLMQRVQTNPITATLIDSAIDRGGLFLSENVFIVGTVNVDETTHMFSPKVLDRAFVLEFAPPKPSVTEAEFTLPAQDAITATKSALWTFLIETSPVNKAKSDDALALLDQLWSVLGSFKFGPRITNEVRGYISECLHLQTIVTAADAHFFDDSTIRDRLVNQKILPKLHGNKSVLTTILSELKKIVEDENLNESKAKVAAMLDSLHKNHFANYFVSV